MKKLAVLLLSTLMIFSLAACGSAPVETTAPETTAVPATETTVPVTEATTEVPVVTAKPLYSEVMDSYYDALLQGFGPADYMDRGLNYMPGFVKDLDQVGYVMDDLDNDGVTELLIGSVEEGLIYAMYTVKDGQEVQVIDAMERSTYDLTSDGLILNRGSNGAASYGYNLYRFTSGELVFQDGLVFDAGKDEQNPWFYTKSETWDNLEPIDTATAEATEQDLLDSVVPVSFIPFSQYTT